MVSGTWIGFDWIFTNNKSRIYHNFLNKTFMIIIIISKPYDCLVQLNLGFFFFFFR